MRSAWICLSQNAHILYLIFCLYHYTQAITIQVSGNAVTAPVQGSALFSVDITCIGTPAVRWVFSSVSRQQRIASWILGGSANVTQMYKGRVQTHPNGSLTLSNLRLQDSGYYIITVTETSGNSQDMGLVLSVTEVLHEDMPFLVVFVIALATLAAFLMLCMWLWNKLYRLIQAWVQRRCLPEHTETELQPL
ncbi:V-set and transmembrane domain-containing protein 5 [Pimephales promelas]|uniref:V-set and transmembrane domain-containing protein 5 n=1 Tax=Pimephales promelas TaxID=90988 RepID=UPI001955ECAC|nr:V-set and transmembrane domain-containing protein 5 [Pimephales promelas]KAG1959842.1 V-set and transmembrane domain-containing protein [Pimephales promelas]